MLEKQMLMSENKLVMESLRDKETFLMHLVEPQISKEPKTIAIATFGKP